jgi:CspA family cold shock protein
MMNEYGMGQEEITHREVTAVVKWFNPAKGFGFVQLGDGSPDAFMHVSVVQRAGLGSVPGGATIICDLCDSPKGPQVATVHSVQSLPETTEDIIDGEAMELEGTVKFYNREKGFGFVIPDDGGKDVFVSARVLQRAGMENLDQDQRVRMLTRVGDKGPMADSIETV